MGHKTTQKNKVRNWLIKYGSIKSMESIDHINNTRLAAGICELRDEGWHIESVPIPNSQFVRYFLRDKPVEDNQLKLF